MASLAKDKFGCRIEFYDRAHRRRVINLGRHVDKRRGETIRSHVAHLVTTAHTGQPVADETAAWVMALTDTRLKDRLIALGLWAAPLAEPEPTPEPKVTLKAFLDAYMASRPDLKESTRVALGQTVRYLTAFFGADKPLQDIRPGDADAWRAHLAGKKKLAEATVRRRCGAAKQFFRAAVRLGHTVSNPFADLKAGNFENSARQYYVTRDAAKKVLDACPDGEWKLIFALARYAGLRCPSEILLLTWADINWAENRILIHSPKTERHPGKDTRQVPLFPELLPYLREVYEAAAPGTEYVITRYRRTNSNLQTQLRRILWNAGIDPWPRLFQNLRASCDTDLAQHHPAHVCARWLGHTPQIAARHYLQVTAADFDRATGGQAHAETDKAQNQAQTPADRPCQPLTADGVQGTKPPSDSIGQGVAAGVSDISTGEWALQDSNLRPRGCDPRALTN